MSSIKWIWLSDRCGVASAELLKLVSRFGGIENIFAADFDSYIDAGISERVAERLSNKDLSDAYSIVNWCEQNRVGLLSFDDKAYPSSLRALKNPPAVLYYIGKLPDLNRELCISVVGTRTVSEYGKRTAYKIAYEMASAGAVIISGMALGIDGISSCAAIAAGGRTVVVLGCGIDTVYPKEHKTLMRFIRDNGAVITEYPPSTPPHGYNFPVRNRIISGLGVGTLVIDAPDGSGALITAKNAILQGKDIYAVPGNIDEPNMTGTNSLIRDGATAVLSGRDVIKSYAFLYRGSIDMQRLARAESRSDYDESSIRKMQVSMRLRAPQSSYGDIPNERLVPREQLKAEQPKAEQLKAEQPKAEQPKNEQPGDGHSIAEQQNSGSDEMEIKKFKEKQSKPKTSRTKEETPAPERLSGDMSEKILKSLSERQAAIFAEMPLDTPVTMDHFTRLGFGMGEVLSTLTVLEIKGLISSLPGALYIRR